MSLDNNSLPDEDSLSEELKSEQLDSVVHHSLMLLRTITNCYGPERGMVMWETIVDALGPEVKGRVFFDMLIGNRPGEIRFTIGLSRSENNVVQAIKTIREMSMCGLKEAKELYDQSEFKVVSTYCPPTQRTEYVNELQLLGLSVL